MLFFNRKPTIKLVTLPARQTVLSQVKGTAAAKTPALSSRKPDTDGSHRRMLRKVEDNRLI